MLLSWLEWVDVSGRARPHYELPVAHLTGAAGRDRASGGTHIEDEQDGRRRSYEWEDAPAPLGQGIGSIGPLTFVVFILFIVYW